MLFRVNCIWNEILPSVQKKSELDRRNWYVLACTLYATGKHITLWKLEDYEIFNYPHTLHVRSCMDSNTCISNKPCPLNFGLWTHCYLLGKCLTCFVNSCFMSFSDTPRESLKNVQNVLWKHANTVGQFHGLLFVFFLMASSPLLRNDNIKRFRNTHLSKCLFLKAMICPFN